MVAVKPRRELDSIPLRETASIYADDGEIFAANLMEDVAIGLEAQEEL